MPSNSECEFESSLTWELFQPNSNCQIREKVNLTKSKGISEHRLKKLRRAHVFEFRFFRKSSPLRHFDTKTFHLDNNTPSPSHFFIFQIPPSFAVSLRNRLRESERDFRASPRFPLSVSLRRKGNGFRFVSWESSLRLYFHTLCIPRVSSICNDFFSF